MHIPSKPQMKLISLHSSTSEEREITVLYKAKSRIRFCKTVAADITRWGARLLKLNMSSTLSAVSRNVPMAW